MKQKKGTPPYGYSTKLNEFERSSALPIPPSKKVSPYRIESTQTELPSPVPQAADSTPTPIFELGWRELHARFLLIASRLDAHSFVASKDIFKLDMATAKRCKELAEEVKRLAERIVAWPKLSGAALAGEKSWAAEKYMDIVAEAQELTGGRVP